MIKFTLPVIEFSATNFSWKRATTVPFDRTTGIAEASHLGLRAGRVPYSRCFVDAADVGCTVLNLAKGTAMNFVLEHVTVDDGDIKCWIFTNNEPDGKLIKLVIFND